MYDEYNIYNKQPATKFKTKIYFVLHKTREAITTTTTTTPPATTSIDAVCNSSNKESLNAIFVYDI